MLDNFSPHLSTKKDDRVGRWAKANNVELAYTPHYASWLNRIEAQFQALRYFCLDGTDHGSHHEQASLIRRYIIWRNRNAHDRALCELVKRANVAYVATRSAWRASQPSSWCRAASTPAWKAWPTVPPAPSTTATRVGGHRPIVPASRRPVRRPLASPTRHRRCARMDPPEEVLPMATRLGTGTSQASGSEWLRVAIVAYQGVLADESWAFRDVFARVPGARVLTVGHRLGIVGGPGGAQGVEATFDERRARRRRRRAGRARQPPPPRDRAVAAACRAALGAHQLDGLGPARRDRAAARPHGGHPLARRSAARAPRRRGVPRAGGRRPPVRHVRRAGQRLRRCVRRRPRRRRARSSCADIRRQLAETREPGPPVVTADPRTVRRRARRHPADGGRRGRARGARRRHAVGDTGHDRAARRSGPWHHRCMGSSPTPDERWASNVVLGDGETVHIRPIRPDDAPALAAFHEPPVAGEHLPPLLLAQARSLTDADLEHFTNVDFVDRVALVVERYGEFIAWASYERWRRPRRRRRRLPWSTTHHQGKGIATLLLEHLAAIARANGIARFTAEVLADNRPMLAVFSRAGWPVERRFESGVVDLDFSLDETEEFLDSVERREQRADSRAMARLLLPRTIAVVGASDTPGSVGEALWRHVTRGADRRRCSPSTRATTRSAASDRWPALQRRARRRVAGRRRRPRRGAARRSSTTASRRACAAP